MRIFMILETALLHRAAESANLRGTSPRLLESKISRVRRRLVGVGRNKQQTRSPPSRPRVVTLCDFVCVRGGKKVNS